MTLVYFCYFCAWTHKTWHVGASFASAAAVHAGLRGSLPAGGSHLHLPPAEPGDPLHLLPARLHHPSFPEPGCLWLPGRALQEVLDPVPVLSESEHHPDQACGPESFSSGNMKPTRLSESCWWVLGLTHIGPVWQDSRTQSLDLFKIFTLEWFWLMSKLSNVWTMWSLLQNKTFSDQ